MCIRDSQDSSVERFITKKQKFVTFVVGERIVTSDSGFVTSEARFGTPKAGFISLCNDCVCVWVSMFVCVCVCVYHLKNLSLANWRPIRMKWMSCKSPQPFTYFLKCLDWKEQIGTKPIIAETPTFQKKGGVGAFWLTHVRGMLSCKMYTISLYRYVVFYLDSSWLSFLGSNLVPNLEAVFNQSDHNDVNFLPLIG